MSRPVWRAMYRSCRTGAPRRVRPISPPRSRCRRRTGRRAATGSCPCLTPDRIEADCHYPGARSLRRRPLAYDREGFSVTG